MSHEVYRSIYVVMSWPLAGDARCVSFPVFILHCCVMSLPAPFLVLFMVQAAWVRSKMQVHINQLRVCPQLDANPTFEERRVALPLPLLLSRIRSLQQYFSDMTVCYHTDPIQIKWGQLGRRNMARLGAVYKLRARAMAMAMKLSWRMLVRSGYADIFIFSAIEYYRIGEIHFKPLCFRIGPPAFLVRDLGMAHLFKKSVRLLVFQPTRNCRWLALRINMRDRCKQNDNWIVRRYFWAWCALR